MKKTILIPTDFSKNAWNAICYAIDLFKRQDCDFHILHTYYLGGYSTDNLLVPEPRDAAYLALTESAEKNMEKVKTHLSFRDDSPGHRFYFSNEFGPLLNIMTDWIEKKDIDFIVMGTRGESDDKNMVFGSNTIDAMEKIRNCPVLAVPGDVLFKDPNEIVFPTSYKTHFKKRELKYLVDIARTTNAPLRILHIGKEEELDADQLEKKELLESIIETVSFSHHYLYNIDVQTGLQCFVQSRESEMIAFINKKHTFFGSIFSNPMVKQLGVHSRVPVLALHDLRN
ncbi:MAG: universal stress protein UspA [Flavobacteriaceae bacterium]|mgnify:CR=1 FL=1|nr:universal stress protein UspA [Flavobacteriaceae bacterium]